MFDGRDVTGWRSDRVTQGGCVGTFQIARGFPRLSVLENLMIYGDRQPGGEPRRAGGATRFEDAVAITRQLTET